MSWLSSAWNFCVEVRQSCRALRSKIRETFSQGWEVQYVEDAPATLKRSRVYVLGTRQHPFQAVIACPCGCGEGVWLDLDAEGDECWRLVSDHRGKASLFPSIWRTEGCESHFWLIDGRIKWC